MTIKVGDRMPAGEFFVMGQDGPEKLSTDELFGGKKVVLFSVPGAFTPTCSAKHLPGFVSNEAALKGKGVDTIACMAVNDVFVMSAWGKDAAADGKVLMLADGNGTYANALGLEMDGSGFGLGTRGQRFSVIVDDGVVSQLNVEAPGAFEVSSARCRRSFAGTRGRSRRGRSPMMMNPFIDVDSLHKAMRRAQSEPIVLFDCRFDLPAPHQGFQRYLDGHLPGARYAHLDRDLARPPNPTEGRHPLPARADFCDFLSASGVTRTSRVVAYDDAGGAIAARLWWLLGEVGHEERQLLSGGFQAWEKAGHDIEVILPSIEPTDYLPAASLNAPALETADIEDFLSGGGVLLDARAGPRFRGEQEPIDPVAGHVPGATNLPFNALLDADGRLLPEADRRRVIEQVTGGQDGNAVATMCGSGVTACFLIAASASVGLGQPRLYAGSWSEWIRDPQRPVGQD